MDKNYELIKKLTGAMGLPGYEDEVRDIIKGEIEGCVDSLRTDRLGNLIAVKNENAPGKHIALAAHMDEVGIVIRSVSADGLLSFSSWGVDSGALAAKPVKVGKNKIPGVVGVKPVHLTTPAEREKKQEIKSLYVDIGCQTRAEAEKLVSPGDFAGFDSEFVEFGMNNVKIKAKALDDRVGCALIIRLLQSDYNGKLTAVFTAQEEVGARGSKAAANQIGADLVINIEGTICNDVCGVDDNARVTVQGEGPAIFIIDSGSVYNLDYIDTIVNTATKYNIPYQFRKAKGGGTDAASFHTARGGTPVISVGVPCRNIHTPVSVMDKRDYENAYELIRRHIGDFI